MPESLLGTPYKEQARGRWPPEGVLADSRVSGARKILNPQEQTR